MVIKGGFRFCNTYLKTFGTKFNSITYLTAKNNNSSATSQLVFISYEHSQ